MRTRLRLATLLPVIALSFSLGIGKTSSTDIVRQRERNTISLELEITKKNANALQRFMAFLSLAPNGYATGFLVSDRLVITAYHVVSGNLDDSKKVALGFARNDELQARVFTRGCQARVVKVDAAADLALLEICSPTKTAATVPFQTSLNQDERLLLIARPRGDRVISEGTFTGPYSMNGLEYWSGRITARDGFSGSPVYNDRGEIVGVFSGYDWSRKLAVISPGSRAQKMLEEYSKSPQP